MTDFRGMEVEVHGVDKAIAGITIGADTRRELEDLIDDTTTYGEAAMRIYAPVGMTGELIRRIDRRKSHVQIGTGMDTVEGVLGVRRGVDRHPLYVHTGTGLYHTGGSEGLITSNTPGKPMRFVKGDDNKPHFRMWVRGQKHQPYVYLAYQAMRMYLAGRVRNIFRGRF